ncbi:pseudouridine synthase [Shewanella sp. NKUCC05_KAH]|uniref:pseudouridine synthase n=1 Tax=Shewanella sp. NKUCC05_KAH TaxID=2842126 RepID=UPI001C5B4DC4|nr:pseudouridine synthase [Shewanella sp. NKUCC05_KAH]MBW3525925.1 pseudouridine synthase [Shewanella sp. NKUCC05_KAH]
MRLDKFLCKSTDLDRKAARVTILGGSITVNGAIVTDCAMQVHENNTVSLNGKPLTPRPSRYIMLHKPANTLCSNVDGAYPSLFHLLDIDRAFDLHIVGRLDADTTGLVLLTDDGRWSFNIISPQYQCEKIYRVQLRDPLDSEATAAIAAKFAAGLNLQGETALTLPATLQQVDEKTVLLTLTEGKFHQVKRMFAAVGNKVVALHRAQIGAVALDIDVGKWRNLTLAEISSFPS